MPEVILIIVPVNVPPAPVTVICSNVTVLVDCDVISFPPVIATVIVLILTSEAPETVYNVPVATVVEVCGVMTSCVFSSFTKSVPVIIILLENVALAASNDKGSPLAKVITSSASSFHCADVINVRAVVIDGHSYACAVFSSVQISIS